MLLLGDKHQNSIHLCFREEEDEGRLGIVKCEILKIMIAALQVKWKQVDTNSKFFHGSYWP